MQPTRQHILNILEEFGQATIDDLVIELCRRRGKITPVTVRHHLSVLQKENLVTIRQMQRNTPGRPKHIYMLAQQDNFERLAKSLLETIQEKLPSDRINVIFDGVAISLASEAQINAHNLEERLKQTIDYLNKNGYSATYETIHEGYILHTHNCPYHQLAKDNDSLCKLDMRLISSILGVVPRLLSTISNGNESCAYLIPNNEHV